MCGPRPCCPLTWRAWNLPSVRCFSLTLDAARTRKQVPSLLLAALSLGTALVVAPDASLFVGLVIFLVLLIVRFVMDRRRGVLNA